MTGDRVIYQILDFIALVGTFLLVCALIAIFCKVVAEKLDDFFGGER